MSAPQWEQLVPQRSAVTAAAGLWSSSPAWRKLVIGSCLLTSLAISAPLALPQPNSCSLQISTVPQRLPGRVTGFTPQAGVLEGTKAVEAQLGAKVSPGYFALKRVNVAHPGQPNPFTFAAIPDNVALKVGDLVELNSRYRDPNLPCNFIPWTVNRVLDNAGD